MRQLLVLSKTDLKFTLYYTFVFAAISIFFAIIYATWVTGLIIWSFICTPINRSCLFVDHLKGVESLNRLEVEFWVDRLLERTSQPGFDAQVLSSSKLVLLSNDPKEVLCHECKGTGERYGWFCSAHACLQCKGVGQTTDFLVVNLLGCKMFTVSTVLPFLADFVTDLNSVWNYMNAGQFKFGTLSLGLWIFTSLKDWRSMLDFYGIVKECCRCGIETSGFLHLKEGEVEDEAIISMMLSIYALPWSVTGLYSLTSQGLGMLLSLKSITMHAVQRDLME